MEERKKLRLVEPDWRLLSVESLKNGWQLSACHWRALKAFGVNSSLVWNRNLSDVREMDL
jgi:hypothetical protein